MNYVQSVRTKIVGILLLLYGSMCCFVFCMREVLYFDVNAWQEKKVVEFCHIPLKTTPMKADKHHFLQKLGLAEDPPMWEEESRRPFFTPAYWGYVRGRPYSRSDDARTAIFFVEIYCEQVPLEIRKKIVQWEKHRLINFQKIGMRHKQSERFYELELERKKNSFLSKMGSSQNVTELGMEDF